MLIGHWECMLLIGHVHWSRGLPVRLGLGWALLAGYRVLSQRIVLKQSILPFPFLPCFLFLLGQLWAKVRVVSSLVNSVWF